MRGKAGPVGRLRGLRDVTKHRLRDWERLYLITLALCVLAMMT